MRPPPPEAANVADAPPGGAGTCRPRPRALGIGEEGAGTVLRGPRGRGHTGSTSALPAGPCRRDCSGPPGPDRPPREPDDGLRADGPAVVPDQRSRREEQSRATGEVMSALAAFRGSCSARRALSAPTRPVMARSCSACVSPRESAPDRTNRQVRLPPPDQSVPWQVVRKAEPLAPPMATPLALLPVALKFPLTTENSHLPLSSPPGKPPEPPLALSLS